MKILSEALLTRVARLSLAERCSIVVLAVALAFSAAATVAFGLRGSTGVGAAALAASVCLLGSLAGLAIGHLLQGPELALQRLLMAMVLRMGIPLAFCLAIAALGGPLLDSGVVYYVLVFYLVTLAVDTVVSLPHDATGDTSS